MNFAETTVLENQFVRLVPLTSHHAPDLAEAVASGNLHKTWYTNVPSPENMAQDIEQRLREQAQGRRAPFAIIDPESGKAVGMTSYLNLAPEHRRLEIGSTFLGRAVQGTKINPAAKLLLLSRAFEDLACNAVEFRTHWHNRQSRAAIAKLGAKQDGVLRSHQILPDGSLRDTVIFSILAHEWPAARNALEARLGLAQRE